MLGFGLVVGGRLRSPVRAAVTPHLAQPGDYPGWRVPYGAPLTVPWHQPGSYPSGRQWLHLNLVQTLRFSGSHRDRHRPGEIILISGAEIRGEVFADHLVAGTTDLGYWNMPFSEVERLDLGTD